MTSRALILPPPVDADERPTDPDIPRSYTRATLAHIDSGGPATSHAGRDKPGEGAAEGDAAADVRANDAGAFYEDVFPCGCGDETDCAECAPEWWVGGRRLEEL